MKKKNAAQVGVDCTRKNGSDGTASARQICSVSEEKHEEKRCRKLHRENSSFFFLLTSIKKNPPGRNGQQGGGGGEAVPHKKWV